MRPEESRSFRAGSVNLTLAPTAPPSPAADLASLAAQVDDTYSAHQAALAALTAAKDALSAAMLDRQLLRLETPGGLPVEVQPVRSRRRPLPPDTVVRLLVDAFGEPMTTADGEQVAGIALTRGHPIGELVAPIIHKRTASRWAQLVTGTDIRTLAAPPPATGHRVVIRSGP